MCMIKAFLCCLMVITQYDNCIIIIMSVSETAAAIYNGMFTEKETI